MSHDSTKMLISVHLPKTAGTSFASSLLEYYGNDSLLKDYSDLPLHQSNFSRNKHALVESSRNHFKNFNDIECIHGHFLPLKYRFIKNKSPVQYVTWVRDPAERLASQYYYMIRNFTEEKSNKQPLLKKMTDENWSLERFCLGPELRNTYSKFLWGFPIKRFNFIGIVEHSESELTYFSEHYLDNSLKYFRQNVNPSTNISSYFNDKHLKMKISEFHSLDYALYQYALNIMKKRKT